jgi:hypothetical protein
MHLLLQCQAQQQSAAQGTHTVANREEASIADIKSRHISSDLWQHLSQALQHAAGVTLYHCSGKHSNAVSSEAT